MSTITSTPIAPNLNATQTTRTIQIDLERVDETTYGTNYRAHILDQYKVYVEMADRISARRMTSNTFFLTIHTTFIGAFSLLAKDSNKPIVWVIVPFIAAILLCAVWWYMLRSYKQLNSGKYKIVNKLEEMLPVAPYEEEWKVLERGRNTKKYLTLTKVEHAIPVIFGVLYVVLAITYVSMRDVRLYA